jgi:DNA-binding response OmpR family regulator
MEELLIVDDDRELTEMLATYFAGESYAVRCASTLRDGFRSLNDALPDLLILDLMLPDGNGLEFCKTVRTKHSALPILMLTARGDPMDRVLGLELGADDYLGKPFEPRELLARTRALLRRARTSEGTESVSVKLGRLEVDLLQRRARIDEQEIALTTIEFKLLAALAKQPTQPMSREALAASVQPGNYRPLPRAVDVQVMRLRKKLREAAGGRELIQTLRGEGYALFSFDE